MEEEITLTPLEWKIYRTIKEKSYSKDENDRWTTQRELVDAVEFDLTIDDKLEYNENDYNHCRRLWTIINNLNQSGRIQKIIVTKDYKYKLGTKSECEAYFKKLRKDALLKLVRLSTLEKRYAMNGQGMLLSSALTPITDASTARGWLESLVPEVIEVANEEAEKAAKKAKKGASKNVSNG